MKTIIDMRKRLGLTQVQLAKLLEITQGHLSDQENAKVRVRRERVFAMRYLLEHPEVARRV